MELRQIRYVLTVAKEGSFTRAADRLNVSQSAISEQVKLLEARLGFPLLRRTGRGAVTTEKGRIFLHEAERISTDLLHLEELARNLREVAVNKINIGMISGLAQAMVPRLFPQGRIPEGLQVEIRTAPTRVIFNELFRERLDMGLAVAMDPDLIPSGLTVQRLFDLDLVLISHPGHPLADTREPVDIHRLDGEPVIMSELAVGYGLAAMSMFGNSGVRPRVVAVVDNIDTMKAMVRSGLGHALVPAGAADLEAEAGHVRVARIAPACPITVEIYRPRAGLSRHKEQFYEGFLSTCRADGE